jgi:hypothetical protein
MGSQTVKQTGKQMDRQKSSQTYYGSCHCETVRFEVRAAIDSAARCNCSLCRRKGVLMSAPFPENHLRILQGRDNLAMYQFNTLAAKHYFCKTCGIHPFHQTRMDAGIWRVNIGCLEGVDPYALSYTIADGTSLPAVK